jgi:hypothetical protein
MSSSLNKSSLKYKGVFVSLFYMNKRIWLSQATYYSDIVTVGLSTGSISDLRLMFDVSFVIDMISPIIALNTSSTLIEFFADVSTYGILNESANSYNKISRYNSLNFSYLLHTLAFAWSTTLSPVKSHLLPTNIFFKLLFPYWSISCIHLLILSNDSLTIIVQC